MLRPQHAADNPHPNESTHTMWTHTDSVALKRALDTLEKLRQHLDTGTTGCDSCGFLAHDNRPELQFHSTLQRSIRFLGETEPPVTRDKT